MKVVFPKRKVKAMGPGVKAVDVPRLHIGFNEDDIPMWDQLPFQGKGGKLAYAGGAMIVIHEYEDDIHILIIKSHTGKRNRRIGEVRVIDETHTAEVIIETPSSARGSKEKGP
jgi:hypothetical protein